MNTHTNERPVTFRHPFHLDAVDEDFPAGKYMIQTLVESVTNSAFRGYKALSTKLVVEPGIGGHSERRMIDIDPLVLQSMFAKDNRSRTPSAPRK